MLGRGGLTRKKVRCRSCLETSPSESMSPRPDRGASGSSNASWAVKSTPMTRRAVFFFFFFCIFFFHTCGGEREGNRSSRSGNVQPPGWGKRTGATSTSTECSGDGARRMISLIGVIVPRRIRHLRDPTQPCSAGPSSLTYSSNDKVARIVERDHREPRALSSQSIAPGARLLACGSIAMIRSSFAGATTVRPKLRHSNEGWHGLRGPGEHDRWILAAGGGG